MNRKGEMNNMGGMIMVFVTVIAALALFGVIVSNIGTTLTTVSVNTTAGTVGFLAVGNSSTTNLNGKLVTDFVALNASSGEQITQAEDNYTISNNQIDSTTGELTAQIRFGNSTTPPATHAGNGWNVSYTYQPLGYLPDAGSRAMASLIAVFAALAIIAVVLFRIAQDKDMFG